MVQPRWLRISTLCLLTMAISGLLTVQSLHLPNILDVEQPAAPRFSFHLPMEITNRVFTNEMLSPASEEYQTLYKEVSDLLQNIYGCPDVNECPTNSFYGGVSAITFRSGSFGSVIVTPTVVFTGVQINSAIVQTLFVSYVRSHEPQTLQFNLRYTRLLTVESVRVSNHLGVEQLTTTTTTTTAPRLAFYLPMEITNKVFTSQLLNPASEEYQTLYKEVSDLLQNIYGCPNANQCPTNSFYGGVSAMTFRSGSVIATPTVVFNSIFINPSIVQALFDDYVKENQPQTLQFNLSYTNDKVQFATTANPTTTTTTSTTIPTTTRTTTTTTTTTKPTTTTTTTIPTTTTPTTTPTTTTTATTTTPTTTSTTTTTTPTTTSTTTSTTTTTPTTTTITPTTTTTITTTPTTTTTPTSPTTTPTTASTTTTTTTMPKTTPTPTTTTTTTTTPTPTPTTTAATPTTTTTAPTTTPTTTTTTTSKTTTKTLNSTNQGNHGYPAVNNTTVNPRNNHTHSHGASTGKPNDPPTSGGSSSNDGSSDKVPGWAIALLVLAAAILLLLIIIFIMMLVRWCCKKTETGYVDNAQDPYYNEKPQPPHAPALPMYSPPTPVRPEPMSTPVIFGDTPKKNRTGFYSVNP